MHYAHRIKLKAYDVLQLPPEKLVLKNRNGPTVAAQLYPKTQRRKAAQGLSGRFYALPQAGALLEPSGFELEPAPRVSRVESLEPTVCGTLFHD